jgi:hypothetical protein
MIFANEVVSKTNPYILRTFETIYLKVPKVRTLKVNFFMKQISSGFEHNSWKRTSIL